MFRSVPIRVALLVMLVCTSALADNLAPTINSVSISPPMAAPTDSVQVQADVTDDVGVAGVMANGTALANVEGSIWRGDIPADDAIGLHTVTVIASDADGNFATDSDSSYRTAQVLGITNRDLAAHVSAGAASTYLFRVVGSVNRMDADTFELNDGSLAAIRVVYPQHGLQTGDYASAQGIWSPGLILNASNVTNLSPYTPRGSITLSARKVGPDVVAITARLDDEQGYPVADGTPVTFSTSACTLDRTQTTTLAGRATVMLSYDPAVDPDTAVVTARTLDQTATIVIAFVSSMDLVASPDRIQASGSGGNETQSTVTATCRDSLGNPATSGEVRFTATRGTITPSIARIDTNGIATAVFTSSMPGKADITAAWSGITQTRSVSVSAGPPYALTVRAEPSSLACDGSSSATVTATVKDVRGNSVADGTIVDFSAIPDDAGGGNGTITPQAATVGGVATACLYTRDSTGGVSRSGMATVRAEVLRASQPADVPLPAADLSNQNTQVEFVSNEVAAIILTANPISIRGWDRTDRTSRITAVVYNADHAPVRNGTVVTWGTSHGIITPSSTTVNGIATATLRADASSSPDWDGCVDITATAGGLTVTRTCLVIFSGPPAYANSVATLSQVVLAPLNGVSTLTVHARDANGNPVEDGMLVSVTTSKGVVSNNGIGTTADGICEFLLFTSMDPESPTPYGVGEMTVTITSREGDATVIMVLPFTVAP